jgi:hypothetical protein
MRKVKPQPSEPCNCPKETAEPKVPSLPKEKSLVTALQHLGVNHNTKSIARYVIETNPTETETEELLKLAFIAIRQRYLENNLLF